MNDDEILRSIEAVAFAVTSNELDRLQVKEELFTRAARSGKYSVEMRKKLCEQIKIINKIQTDLLGG